MTASKHFINSPDDVVTQAIDGFIATHHHLTRLDGYPSTKVLIDSTFDKYNHVAVVSGGGSGHEPAFGGYVGNGILAAAVAGEVFASPSEDAVLAAIRAVTGPKGCLVLVNNYTGDRLHFGGAVERAKAEGLAVDLVAVADDCALPGKTRVGRRGIAGMAIVLKIAGAVAADGGSLSQVTEAAEMAAANIGSMGCSLSVCTLPGQSRIEERIGAEEMEMGLGLHGEPGAYKEKVRAVDGIVAEMIDKICGESAETVYLPLTQGERIALLINNLGGTSSLEMGVVTRAAINVVENQLVPAQKVKLERVLVGSFMTSLEMRGVSISVLRLGENGDKVLEWLDREVEAPAWPRSKGLYIKDKELVPVPREKTSIAVSADQSDALLLDANGQAILRKCIISACIALLNAHEELDRLDAAVGDGDCGSTMAKGASEVLQLVETSSLPLDNVSNALLEIAKAAGGRMGGTSGAIIKIFLTAAGVGLTKSDSIDGNLSINSVATALENGIKAVIKYGGAQPGDRTMVDAFVAALDALNAAMASGESAAAAADKVATGAEEGAVMTQTMKAGAGRSTYVPEEALRGVMDPGAKAVAVWMRAVAQALQ